VNTTSLSIQFPLNSNFGRNQNYISKFVELEQNFNNKFVPNTPIYLHDFSWKLQSCKTNFPSQESKSMFMTILEIIFAWARVSGAPSPFLSRPRRAHASAMPTTAVTRRQAATLSSRFSFEADQHRSPELPRADRAPPFPASLWCCSGTTAPRPPFWHHRRSKQLQLSSPLMPSHRLGAPHPSPGARTRYRYHAASWSELEPSFSATVLRSPYRAGAVLSSSPAPSPCPPTSPRPGTVSPPPIEPRALLRPASRALPVS
jgi:hypothetical protein